MNRRLELPASPLAPAAFFSPSGVKSLNTALLLGGDDSASL